MKKKNAHVVLSALALSLAVTGFTPATRAVPNPFAVTAEAAAKVKLNKSKTTLTPGQESRLELKGYGKTVKWSSSNKKVATVNKEGLVQAKKKGTTVITAKAGKKKYKCKVTVKALKVKSLKLNQKTLTMKKGSKATLKATASPSNASNKAVTWNSSNTKIATVSSKGVVTAKKNGTVTITATSKDGSKKRATCKITVKAGDSKQTSTSEKKDSVKNVYNTTSEDEKGLNIPKNDMGTTWGFDIGNNNTRPLQFKVGETTVVEYLGTVGLRGDHPYTWTLECTVGMDIVTVDPLNNGYVKVSKVGNKFYITPLKERKFTIHVFENTIREDSGLNRNFYCHFQIGNPTRYTGTPEIGEKCYRLFHHLDSPVYTVKSMYLKGWDTICVCEESTTGNTVEIPAAELESASIWES